MFRSVKEAKLKAETTVTFYGVRGSTPCHCATMARYGGNTSCVVIESDGMAPIVLDAGTGLRFYGLDYGDQPFDGTLLLTHLHWDHVQGLPFFSPFLAPDSSTTILGPPESEMDFATAISGFLRPPYFPVRVEDLPSSLVFRDFSNETLEVGGAQITAAPVPHTGATNGYRVDIGDVSIAYIPDHQQPDDGKAIADSVLELVDGVDLLIHDAQFTDDLLKKRSDWGHCTPAYALHVAETAKADTLALFHHDPLHSDEMLDDLRDQTALASSTTRVVAAAEGLKISL